MARDEVTGKRVTGKEAVGPPAVPPRPPPLSRTRIRFTNSVIGTAFVCSFLQAPDEMPADF